MEFVPNKLYYKIREVCEIAGVEAHVLRFWETEFPALAPPKNRNGQRTYRPGDIELILEIRKLLYEDGYTIAGARKRMGMPTPPAPTVKKRSPKNKSQALESTQEPAKPSEPEFLPFFINHRETETTDQVDFIKDFREAEANDQTDSINDSGETEAIDQADSINDSGNAEATDQAGFIKNFREAEANARINFIKDFSETGVSDQVDFIKDLDETEVIDQVRFSKDLKEAQANARRDLIELRELTQPNVPKNPAETPSPGNAVIPPTPDDDRPTSERLKRVQMELENILTLLDRE